MSRKKKAPISCLASSRVGLRAVRAGGFFAYLAAASVVYGELALSQPLEEVAPASIHVAFDHGILTLDLKDAPVAEVLRSISELTGLQVVSQDDLTTLLTLSATEMTLERGLRRILRDRSWILVSGGRHGADGEGSVAKLFVLSPLGAEYVYAAPAVIAGPVAPPSLKETIIGDVASQNTRVRVQALHEFLQAEVDGTADLLVQILAEDDDATMRRQAAIALGKFSGEEAGNALSQVVLNDPDPNVRRQAVRSLSAIRDEFTRWALQFAMSDSHPIVRQAAEVALAEWK